MKVLTLAQADRKRFLTGLEFLFIGSVPHEEQCTQAGYEDLKNGEIECEVLINQLRRINGQEPEGCEFFILENHHDFGIYHEAAIFYKEIDEEQEEESESEIYALGCEDIPEAWDMEAKQELRDKGHTQYQPAKVIRLKIA